MRARPGGSQAAQGPAAFRRNAASSRPPPPGGAGYVLTGSRRLQAPTRAQVTGKARYQTGFRSSGWEGPQDGEGSALRRSGALPGSAGAWAAPAPSRPRAWISSRWGCDSWEPRGLAPRSPHPSFWHPPPHRVSAQRKCGAQTRLPRGARCQPAHRANFTSSFRFPSAHRFPESPELLSRPRKGVIRATSELFVQQETELKVLLGLLYPLPIYFNSVA